MIACLRPLPVIVVLLVLTPGVAVSQPKNPDLTQPRSFALIEFGATRVAFVQAEASLESVKDADPVVRFEVKELGYLPPIAGITEDGKLVLKQLQEAAQSVARVYHVELIKKLKVDKERIQIIADSHFSARTEDERKMIEEEVNKAINDPSNVPAGWETRRIPVTILTPKEEGGYRTYEMKHVDTSIGDYTILDVAPGATVPTYMVPKLNTGLKEVMADSAWIPGSLGLRDKIQDNDAFSKQPAEFYKSFPKYLPTQLESDITQPLRTLYRTKPGFANFKKNYIVGDAAAILAIYTKPDQVMSRDLQITVKVADIVKLDKLLMNSRKNNGALTIPQPEIPSTTPYTISKVLFDEYAELKKSYHAEQLAAVSGILRTWSEEFQFGDGDDREIILLRNDGKFKSNGQYVRNSQYLLAIGYLRGAVATRLLAEK